jgi:RNA polymerase sigma-70 factor (sigma-E family)
VTLPKSERNPDVPDQDPEFEEFLTARWQPLYRTAYLLTGNRQDAEDLLQSALAATCARWSSIRDKGAADGYVRRSLVNGAQRTWRRRAREVVREHLPEESHDDLGVRADHLTLWHEVRRLPPRMRITLVLRYFEDLSVTETARELGCSEGVVKSNTHHAIQRLRQALPSLELTEELS